VRVITTAKASRDLDEWIGRIREDNPLAAAGFLQRIIKATDLIAIHPEIGKEHKNRKNIRKLLENPIIIYYEVFEDRIEILRFWHASRNPKAIRYR